MADFGNARKWAECLIRENVGEGARVIDATMGNGYDTLWLCSLVGDTGHVYAFDIQPDALTRTRDRLECAGVSDRASLYCVSHADMEKYAPYDADAILFNLGWLPGGEHAITTRAETTLAAVEAAIRLLKKGGILTICVYPGHSEGQRERDRLIQWACALPDDRYDARVTSYVNLSKQPPLLIAVTKRA